MSQIIRRPALNEQSQWQRLWEGYLQFYQAKNFSPELTDLLWSRIHDLQHPIQCFVSEDITRNQLSGLVHFFPHTNTWKAGQVCYLEDLYVDSTYRGNGVGRALIQAVINYAKEQSWEYVYWHTQHDNHNARELYDRLTGGTDGFVTYRISF
ncbi:GNAT family N-acetyltransferase [Aliikangiella coralliicola]|uniref:GNAT family N-acetyltransferase n=1 Tax=Aliikangiella coralliicola TaxID=2592383 RepID=A0A545UD72_9GAMM|nr:GNAT family N-acetyltransferase [Aliikangiella coralliicola]TQV87412.1 GNAT family N-acetyltransferase [Aliikangiella coralliicola]